MWCFFSDTRAPTFCVALPNLVYLCYILLLKIYFPQNKKEIDRNLDISVPVFNSFSYSMRSISSRHTLVMHAVPSELQAAHEEGKIKYLRPEEVKKNAWSHWLSQPKQLVASLPQQSVILRRSRLAQVQDWFGEGGGVLIMTQRQSLNQPSLSMLISSILFLMNWLACERTGGNYSNWGEWQEQGRGWGRGEVCCEWAGWMKGGCVCVFVFGGSLSGSFLQDRAITRPGRDTLYVDHSMVLCQRQTTVLWSLYFLHFSEKFGRKRKTKGSTGDEKRDVE